MKTQILWDLFVLTLQPNQFHLITWFKLTFYEVLAIMITPCGLYFPAFQHNDQTPSIYITSRGDTNFDYSLSVFSSFCLFILFYHVRKRSSKYDRQRRQVVFCSKKLVIEYFCGKSRRLRFETLAYKIILLHFIAVYRW